MKLHPVHLVHDTQTSHITLLLERLLFWCSTLSCFKLDQPLGSLLDPVKEAEV